jgi:hypothetical protein
LRAGEPKAVDDVVRGMKNRDADLLRAVAAAQREGALARSAADIVKKDISEKEEREQLSSDEMAAIPKLRESAALAALLARGQSDPRAHALALFSALDRMQIGHDLPRRLKIPLASSSLSLVFGVEAPVASQDPNKRWPAGTWLQYLSDVARAAGHPVPPNVDDIYDRHEYAWAGVLEGFADKLRGVLDHLSGDPLARYVANVIKVIDAQSNYGISSMVNRVGKPAPSPTRSKK